ncbi:MAG: sigma-70 family RNA polymerase sigma factor [Parcubacteria group bacterium]|jgi:RNA polymerase sigma-70 factor (ECF subfamily)
MEKNQRISITDTDVMEDNEIVAKVQNGEEAFFDCVIKRYEQKIFAYIMRLVKNADEARDLTQIVFIKSLRHIDSFDTNKKFSSWIYRIAHNETMNWFGHNNHNRTVSIDDVNGVATRDFADSADVALEEWFQAELRDELRDALAQLPVHYAEVLRMKYFEDKSYKEIGDILHKPVSSVGTLIRRAKKRLLVIVLQSERL